MKEIKGGINIINRIKGFLDKAITKLNESIKTGHIRGSDIICVKSIEENDGYFIVRLKGNLISDTLSVSSRQAKQNGEHFDKHIIVDFNDVKHIDCAALAVLVNMFTELKAHSKKLVIINATKELISYIDILRLKPIISILSSEKEAIAHFGRLEQI